MRTIKYIEYGLQTHWTKLTQECRTNVLRYLIARSTWFTKVWKFLVQHSFELFSQKRRRKKRGKKINPICRHYHCRRCQCEFLGDLFTFNDAISETLLCVWIVSNWSKHQSSSSIVSIAMRTYDSSPGTIGFCNGVAPALFDLIFQTMPNWKCTRKTRERKIKIVEFRRNQHNGRWHARQLYVLWCVHIG